MTFIHIHLVRPHMGPPLQSTKDLVGATSRQLAEAVADLNRIQDEKRVELRDEGLWQKSFPPRTVAGLLDSYARLGIHPGEVPFACLLNPPKHMIVYCS